MIGRVIRSGQIFGMIYRSSNFRSCISRRCGLSIIIMDRAIEKPTNANLPTLLSSIWMVCWHVCARRSPIEISACSPIARYRSMASSTTSDYMISRNDACSPWISSSNLISVSSSWTISRKKGYFTRRTTQIGRSSRC